MLDMFAKVLELEGLRVLSNNKVDVDLIILEYRMQKMDGVRFLKEINWNCTISNLYVVTTTGARTGHDTLSC